MTGLNGNRVYLDWNATAPLRPEARQVMLEAMDVVGNPSSVHAEGRAAKAIIEKARGQVAALVGCDPDEVVFTSGATEAAAIEFASLFGGQAICAEVEHECVVAHRSSHARLSVSRAGEVVIDDQFYATTAANIGVSDRLAIQSANSETGVLQPLIEQVSDLVEVVRIGKKAGNYSGVRIFSDIVQSFGKVDFNLPRDVDSAIVSAHKISGPTGAGALIARRANLDGAPLISGGGQEKGRRSGTENVIGIAGFGAAAEAAQRDLEAGVWDEVEKLRNILEDTLASEAKETIFFGQESPRLPNTSCFAVPGWAGETQVMQMDLAGFAVSAGSACSSGKVNKASRVLLAMGFDEITASSAIRVSMGPTTTEAEVLAFADAWKNAYRRRKARAALDSAGLKPGLRNPAQTAPK